MKRYWGERCPEYQKGCGTCEAWKCFDFIFLDIDENDERLKVD